MDLELATFNDITDELERRKVQFLFVAVEPTNKQDGHTVHIGAASTSRRVFVQLLRMARSAFDRGNCSE